MKIKNEKNRSHIYKINLGLATDMNILNIKMSWHKDAYIYQATPKQHLKVTSWKSLATPRLSWKIALPIKKRVINEWPFSLIVNLRYCIVIKMIKNWKNKWINAFLEIMKVGVGGDFGIC